MEKEKEEKVNIEQFFVIRVINKELTLQYINI